MGTFILLFLELLFASVFGLHQTCAVTGFTSAIHILSIDAELILMTGAQPSDSHGGKSATKIVKLESSKKHFEVL
jgi:hypothetical protein